MGITRLIRAIVKKKTAAPETGDAVKNGGVCAVLDHPQQGQKITAPQYTFRVGATGPIELAAISINQGPWQPCRNSSGYWWYDWSGYTEGRYQAEVKVQTKDGRVVTSGPCKFQVVFVTGGKQR